MEDTWYVEYEKRIGKWVEEEEKLEWRRDRFGRLYLWSKDERHGVSCQQYSSS